MKGGRNRPRGLEKEQHKKYVETFDRTLDYVEKSKEGLEKELYVEAFRLRRTWTFPEWLSG